jgi:hypothetical protein
MSGPDNFDLSTIVIDSIEGAKKLFTFLNLDDAEEDE